MEFKPDWEQTKKRFQSFWAGENEQCLMAVTAPKTDSDWSYYDKNLSVLRFKDSDEESIKQWWCDPEENLKRFEFIVSNTFYGGEALPIACTCWGAMVMCAFFGSPPVFRKETVWYDKVIEDWASWQWSFDKATNPYWKATRDITSAFAEAGKGRYFAGLPELGDGADVLSLMRGMDTLCTDLYDYPDDVKRGMQVLTETFLQLQDELFDIASVTYDGGGILPWMSLWMPGKQGNQLACDFSWVISNRSFREFFLPYILREANWCDYATYHLDGEMCMRNHLETLLETDAIKAIEWTPGDGCPKTLTPEYIPAYKRILEKGKKLILIPEPDEVDTLTQLLPHKGLFIKTFTQNEEQARALMKIVERNYKEGTA